MGILDKVKGLLGGKNKRTAQRAVDKAADVIQSKAPDSVDEKVEAVAEKAKDMIDKVAGEGGDTASEAGSDAAS